MSRLDGEVCEIKVSHRLKAEELERKIIELENLKL